MGQRLLAVAVVIASACTALHFSTTQQESVVISNNPYHFPGGGSATFTISPASSFDHDLLQSITMDCSSQWSLNTGIDPQQPVLGANVCGSGSGSQIPTATFESGDQALPCPRNYQFAVTFLGTQPGVSSCNVVVTTVGFFGGSNYEAKTLSLSGSGSAVTGITVSPDEIDFKDVQINSTSTSREVTVLNLGTASITVNGNVTTTGFLVTPSPTSFGLGPGSSMKFDVSCMPQALGPLSATLSFSSSTGSNGSTMLTCNGINSPVTLAPDQVSFANTLVGRAPPTKTIGISSANGSATIDAVTLDTEAMTNGVTIVSNPQGMAIGAGKTVVLAYSAAAMHEAGSLGTLSLTFSNDPNPRSVGISGQALVGDVATNPASVDFGAVCAGSKMMKDVEVYASEPGDVVLQQMTKPAAPFDAMLMDAVPKTLGGNHTGANMMVRTTFEPATPGDFKDAIALTTDVPDKPTTEIEVLGIGLAAGIAATPDVVHFGVAPVATTTSIQEVQFTNCGTGDLMFSRAYITGADALEFTLIGANPAKTLKPTESETFMVVMQPDSNGLKTAQLVIEHDAGTTTAALDGTGEGGSDKERETYYACSTGHSAALWPIALALVVLRRRRRR